MKNIFKKFDSRHQQNIYKLQYIITSSAILASPIKTTVIVTEADILSDDLLDEKPRTVKICSKYKGQTDCQVLILSYNTGHLLVQSDKPIYTPNQRGKF